MKYEIWWQILSDDFRVDVCVEFNLHDSWRCSERFYESLKVFKKSFVLQQRNEKAFSSIIYFVKYCRDILVIIAKLHGRYILPEVWQVHTPAFSP